MRGLQQGLPENRPLPPCAATHHCSMTQVRNKAILVAWPAMNLPESQERRGYVTSKGGILLRIRDMMGLHKSQPQVLHRGHSLLKKVNWQPLISIHRGKKGIVCSYFL